MTDTRKIKISNIIERLEVIYNEVQALRSGEPERTDNEFNNFQLIKGSNSKANELDVAVEGIGEALNALMEATK